MKTDTSGRDWMNELVARGVLNKIPGTMRPVPGGVVLICDSETNPMLVVPIGVPDCPVRLIANESGVLILSPCTKMRSKIGVDAEQVVVEPIVRAWREGIHRVILCVNPHSIAGPMLKIKLIELIDHMIRAGEWLQKRVEELPVGYLVHAQSEDGTYNNYYVEQTNWHLFYNWYEKEFLGRQDDPDPGYPSGPIFGQM